MSSQRPQYSAGGSTNTPSNSASSNSTNQTSYDNILTPKDPQKGRHTSSAHGINDKSPMYDDGSLEYFTNNHFSRSFNSLILDDIKTELKTSKRGVPYKKKINKSPPFNVKQEIPNDSIDDYLNEEIGPEINNDDTPDGIAFNDDDLTSVYQSPTLKILNPKKLFNQHDYESEEDTEKFNQSQQSSIKRSSKFLNLSIDSNLRTLNNKANEDIDNISDLNEIESSSIINNSRENTPFANSSPSQPNTHFHNKYKRPHKLISQSPSPSSGKVPVYKSQLYQFNWSPEQKKLYSPSKLGYKGFKIFKTLERDAVISPNRPSSEQSKKGGLFDSGKSRLSVKKIRKTNLNLNKSPFNKPDSSPLLSNLEYYNLDDINIDSPSKNRKSSNSSNPPTAIYHDDEETIKKNRKVKSSSKEIEFNDKENKSYDFIKPLQTAFKTTGLMKKSSLSKDFKKPPPETPIKKHPLMLLNANKSGLSNVINSANEEYDEHSEVSIEVGRNNTSYGNGINDSTSSFFKIPSTTASQKTANLLNTDLDIDMSSDIDLNIPETPTKSVKKSNSTPANFSPVSFQKLSHHLLSNNGDKMGTHKVSRNLRKKDYKEPSTPTNWIFKPCEPTSHVTFPKTLSKVDDHLVEKFGMKNIKYIGSGEFSVAYECQFQNQKFAIKKSKKPIIGKSEKETIMREIEALRVLTSVKDNEKINLQEQEEGKEYLVYFIEAWDFNNYYYIMTEFCDNGTLFDFLEEHKSYKIDEFRVWKILIEILSGLMFIHSKNYLHLDLKPANIFITFEGSLKIGDFGLATKLPILEKDFDLEGDRNYIAPELINDKIYTPFADIFSVGLIILEAAANIILPENGTPWRKLRSGDLSDAGKLSSDNLSDFLQHQNLSSVTSCNSMILSNQSLNHNMHFNPSINIQKPSSSSVNEIISSGAPEFLVNGDSMNLDKLVNKMLRPNPFERPTARMVLEMSECVIIENRRKEGATIFEGEFGPIEDDD